MFPIKSILSIASVTFREIVRDKVFYNILALGFFLFAAAYLASQLTFVRPERVVLSFGLTSFMITGLVMSILLGASLIPKEYEKRTIYLALSKPLTRLDFLLGKFLGLSIVIIVNWVFLSCILALIYKALGGILGLTFFWACVFMLMQFILASSIAVFFSTRTTVSLSVILTVMVYLIGVNASQLEFLSQKSESILTKNIFSVFSRLIPQFESYHLGVKVIYQLPLDPSFIFFITIYTFMSVLFFLFISGFLLGYKDS